MKHLLNFLKLRFPFLLFLIFYLLFAVFTYKDYGLTMDEFFVYTRGEYFYTKVKGNDPKLQKGFVIDEGNNDDILYNNSSYPAVLYMLNNSGDYETYHLINFFMAILIFYLLYELLLQVYKKPTYALLGPFILFFTPRFLGHIPANPKDIPFAVWYFASLTAMFLSRKIDEKLQILIVGCTIGVTASIRFVGFTLIPIYFLFHLIDSWDVKAKLEIMTGLILKTSLIGLICFLIFLINMPYVAADPFNHFVELLQITKQYPWFGEIVLFGQKYTIEQRPFWYILIWILITTPLPLLFFFFSGWMVKLNKEKRLLQSLILISLFVQLLFYLLLKPVIYNGLRHYLFVIPHIVILGAVGYLELIKTKYKLLAQILLVIFILTIISSYKSLHPYEYTYFNGLTGGLKGAQHNFESEYWGASDKEAMNWLSDYLRQNEKNNVSVFSCSKSHALSYYMPEVKDVNTNIYLADYIICYEPYQRETIEKKLNVTKIHVVERLGVPLNVVYKVDN